MPGGGVGGVGTVMGTPFTELISCEPGFPGSRSVYFSTATLVQASGKRSVSLRTWASSSHTYLKCRRYLALGHTGQDRERCVAAGALMPCRRSRAGWGGTAGGHQLAPAPPDFPAPVVTDRQSPLFDAGQVVDWLVSTGRKHLPELTVELRLHLLTAPGGQRAPMPPTTMLAAV